MHRRLWSVALGLCLVASPVIAKPAPNPKALVVDGKGNGILKVWEYRHDHSPGTWSFGTRLVEGLTAFQSHLSVPDPKGMLLHAFVQATQTHFDATGSLHVPLERELQGVTGDMTATGEYAHSASKANAHLTLAIPGAALPVSAVDLDMDSSLFGYKVSEGQMHYHMTGDLVHDKVVPEFTAMDARLTQENDVTTLTVSLTVPGPSQGSRVFREIGSDSAAAEQQIRALLTELGANVQTVQVSRLRATDAEAGADVTISVVGLTETVRTKMKAMLESEGPRSAVQVMMMANMLNRVLAVHVDRLEVHASAHDKDFDLTSNSRISNVDQLLLGYLDGYTELLRSIDKHKDGSGGSYVANSAMTSLKLLGTLLEAAAASSSNDRQTVSIGVHYAHDGHAHTVRAAFDGQGDLQGLVSAAEQIQYPMVSSQVQQFSLKTDGHSVDGSLHMLLEGPWLEAARRPYIVTARQTPGLEAMADSLQAFQLVDTRMSIGLENGAMDMVGYLQTSDLSGLVHLALQHFSPRFSAVFTGLDAVGTNPYSRTSWDRTDFYLQNLPPGVPAAIATLEKMWHGKLGHASIKRVPTSELTPPPLGKPTVPGPPL